MSNTRLAYLKKKQYSFVCGDINNLLVLVSLDSCKLIPADLVPPVLPTVELVGFPSHLRFGELGLLRELALDASAEDSFRFCTKEAELRLQEVEVASSEQVLEDKLLSRALEKREPSFGVGAVAKPPVFSLVARLTDWLLD